MRHVLTLIAPPTNLTGIHAVVTALGLQPHWLHEPAAADIFLPDHPGDAWLASLRLEADAAGIDFIFQPAANREKKLLVSDMDSTLIHQECIDELADVLGIKPQVATITERAMNGELDFPAALRERVALLKNLPASALEEAYATRITLMEGARTLVQTMRARGAHCLLVSGGFTFFTQRVAAALGFHADEANQLEIIDGKLTGHVIDPILDKASKRESLHRATAQHHLTLVQTLAVGDGANDLPMLLDAGLGVAYHAKPMVQAQAQHRLNHTDLSALLYAQGIPRTEWKN